MVCREFACPSGGRCVGECSGDDSSPAAAPKHETPCANSYRGTSDEPANTRIEGEHAARYFKQSFELKIKPLLAELQELFARHGASARSGRVSVRERVRESEKQPFTRSNSPLWPLAA